MIIQEKVHVWQASLLQQLYFHYNITIYFELFMDVPTAWLVLIRSYNEY